MLLFKIPRFFLLPQGLSAEDPELQDGVILFTDMPYGNVLSRRVLFQRDPAGT